MAGRGAAIKAGIYDIKDVCVCKDKRVILGDQVKFLFFYFAYRLSQAPVAITSSSPQCGAICRSTKLEYLWLQD